MDNYLSPMILRATPSKYDTTITEAQLAFNNHLMLLENIRDHNTNTNKISAFCVGMPKTGTHSIAKIFSRYRSSHEADQIFMIMLLAEKLSGKINAENISNLLRSRQSLNNLEMDASHYNGAFIKEISHISPNSRYILTFREPYSWLDSWFNQHLNSPNLDATKVKHLGRKLYFDYGDEYSKHDSVLYEHGLYPLKSYLKFWDSFNRSVVASLDSDKLLTLRTQNISTSIGIISNFLKIDKSTISNLPTHDNPTTRHHRIVEKLDSSYVSDLINLICENTISLLSKMEGSSQYAK